MGSQTFRTIAHPTLSPMAKEGYRVLKCSIVLRTPTRVERACRPPIVLGERDQEILAAVHAHGFLPAQLVALAFFPNLPVSPFPSSAVYRRLRLLWLARYLDRLQFPVARGLGGSRPDLYTLGPRAVATLSSYLARRGQRGEEVRRRRLDRLNAQFLDHDLAAAALWASLTRCLAAPEMRRRVCRWHWEAERELRARHLRVRDPDTRRRYPFVPDGYFEIEYTARGAATSVAEQALGGEATTSDSEAGEAQTPAPRVQCCVLEVDMGTQSLHRFKRKLRAFELALDQGVFEREWYRPEFEVLVLTSSTERLEHLCAAARDVVPDDRWGWYSFATLDVLAPDAVASNAWRTLEGDEVLLLLHPAVECAG